MLPPDIALQIDEIASDRASGATELALRAARLLVICPEQHLREAAHSLIHAQPAMASVYNAAQAAFTRRLPEFLERLQNSPDVIARKVAGLVRGKVVLTHSYSSTVVAALRRGQPARIVCTHSLPGGEGCRTATLLHGTLIADAAVCAALSDIDVVLIGADAVRPSVIVNKVGTALIAQAARARCKPVWVLCGSEKFVPEGWTPDLGSLFEEVPREWFSNIIDDS